MACPPAFRCLALVSVVLGPSMLWAVDQSDQYITSAVSSVVDRNYRRTTKADGTVKPEYYAISFGGQAIGTGSDSTMDGVQLESFRSVLETHLAKQNYLLAENAASAELLLHVTWGVTRMFDASNYQRAVGAAGTSLNRLRWAMRNNPGSSLGGGFGLPEINSPEVRAEYLQAEADLVNMMMENRHRDYVLRHSARLLGYLDPINELVDNPARHAGLGAVYDELREDIENPRYYVVVTAYDFPSAAAGEKLKPLWTTRISIDAKGNRFDARYADMLERAGGYFGRDSGGLQRKRRSSVEFGEPEVIRLGDEVATPPDAVR